MSELKYFVIQNEAFEKEVFSLIITHSARKFFNVIDISVINFEGRELIQLVIDKEEIKTQYNNNNYFSFDPFLKQVFYTRRQTYHFKESEFSSIKVPGTNINAGIFLNEQRKKIGRINSGMYRTFQITKKSFIMIQYGLEKSNFSFDIDFSVDKNDGLWFFNFEISLIEIIKKYFFSTKGFKKD